MSIAELLPSVKALRRSDKFFLVQELISDLAREEGLAEGEYEIWSPYDAHEAADKLMKLLEEGRSEAA